MNPLIDFADMIPRGRGRGRDSVTQRGKGRGRYPSNYSNYSNEGNILATIGNKKLIASNLSGISGMNSQDLELFNQWKTIHKKEGDTPSSSEIRPYINAFKGEGKIEQPYIENGKKQIIMLLNNSDKKWEENPWHIYDRYIMEKGYAMEVYKTRLYYEIILSENGCEFKHYHLSSNKTAYGYSKILIQKIISMDEWGITPYKEKTAVYNHNTLQYNYFDYMEAFNKVFFYQNDPKTHTWLIKIYPEVLNHPLPTWVIKWWQFYGTSEEILPELFIDYYRKWCKVIPTTSDQEMTGYTQLWFFIEFSIPYIWKSEPLTGYTQDRIFCLKRRSFTRFWDKMLYKDPETKELNSAYTIKLLNEKITYYSQQAQIKEQLRLEKIANTPLNELDLQNMTKREIVNHNMKFLINILKNKESDDEKRSQKSDGDISMTSTSHANNEDILTLLQDSQALEGDNDILEEIRKNDELVRQFLEGTNDDEETSGSSKQEKNDSSRKGKGKV